MSNTEEFVKTGRVEAGKTPSERSLKKSDMVKNGQALCEDERPVKDLSELEMPTDE